MSNQPNENQQVIPALAMRFLVHKITGNVHVQMMTFYGEVVESVLTVENIEEAARAARVQFDSIVSEAHDEADEIEALNSLLYNDGNDL